MPSIIVKILLFLSSYFPLFAILTLLSWSKNRNLAYAFIATGIFSWAGLELYLWYVRSRVHAEKLSIRSSQQRDAEILSYIVTYLIPFMADFSKPPLDLLALGIFFVVIGFLYVNSNMIHINPMLNLRGYHLFEVELKDGSSHSVLTKKRLRCDTTINAVAIGDHVYLHKESNA
jgi:hypothetical protein